MTRLGLFFCCLLFPIFGWSAGFSCPTPTAAVRKMPELQRIYSDVKASIVNQSNVNSNNKLMAPIDFYVGQIAKFGDAYLRSKSVVQGQCVGSWLKAWASADALANPSTGFQESDINRYMFLSAVAMNYLKTKPVIATADQRVIETWLSNLATQVKANRKRMNHTNNLGSWAALGLMTAGMTTGHNEFINEAYALYVAQINMIKSDGTLDAEMNRGVRALIYHNFAVTPLVMMAELSRKIGENWYSICGGRLYSLERATLYGYAYPAWFAKRAGMPAVEMPTPSAWIGIFMSPKNHPEYYRTHANYPNVGKLKNYKPYEPRFGSSVDVLMQSGFFKTPI